VRGRGMVEGVLGKHRECSSSGLGEESAALRVCRREEKTSGSLSGRGDLGDNVSRSRCRRKVIVSIEEKREMPPDVGGRGGVLARSALTESETDGFRWV